MTITFPDLPFPENGVEPYISSRTLSFHHGKHHKAYVDNANKLVQGTDLSDAPVEDIITATAGNPSKTGLFNNAAQAWNHAFYWQCMRPGGGGKPTGAIAKLIESDLGGYEKFKESFISAGMTQFGSGWAWLVRKEGKVEVWKSSNADTPLAHGFTPLLTVDVWEHAYYLDYQNKRADYLNAFVDYLINWDFVSKRL
jgi:Fe-Mn family superoxide dismutase